MITDKQYKVAVSTQIDSDVLKQVHDFCYHHDLTLREVFQAALATYTRGITVVKKASIGKKNTR